MTVPAERETTWGAWRLRAACRGYENPDAFFPIGEDPADAMEAKAVCAGCPVEEQCLAANLRERDGIYGGKTPRERRRLRGLRR